MKKVFRHIQAAALVIMCAGCSKTAVEEHVSDRSTELSLSISAGCEGKAIFTGTSLAEGSEVGAALFGTDGNTYDGVKYENIRYLAKGAYPAQSWDPDMSIMLSASKATLYTYYPYSKDVNSLKSIPVTASTTSQTDYMYGTPVTGLYNHNPSATVILNHALSAIRVSLTRGTYSGEGSVSAISVRSPGISCHGVLDATTGTISSFREENSWISPPISTFKLNARTDTDIIIIPNGTRSAIEINIIIDGETFIINTDPVLLNRGSIASYNVTVNNGSADISGMKVNEWGYSPEGNPTIQKDYSITLTGDMEGISFDNKSYPDGSVQIIAVPYHSKDAEVNPVTYTGNATLVQETDLNSGVRIITLSDIKSDISIIFSSYTLWMTAKYKITDTSSPTSLYYHTASRFNNPVRMQIDGSEIDSPVSSHRFSSEGEHTVRYAFKDKTEIGHSFFNDITAVTYAKIPEGVRTLAYSVFSGSRGLTSVSLPESLTSIQYDCFRNASSLKSIIIPESATNLGTGIFRGCISLTDIRLPSGLKKLPDTIFRECTSLKSMKLHEGLTTIGSSSFIYSGIESVDLPSSLTYIDSDGFSNCYSLLSITCRAVTPPDLYAYSDVFMGIPGNGVINVPSGAEETYRNRWLTGQLLSKSWTISTIK